MERGGSLPVFIFGVLRQLHAMPYGNYPYSLTFDLIEKAIRLQDYLTEREV
jgi:hypothetical protein